MTNTILREHLDPYRRAIYIDFETLKTPPTIALLGALKDIEGRVDFEQIILDEPLHAAEVARRHLRAGALERTVAGLLATGLPLIGWSVFDRDIVLVSGLSTELKEQWKSRYVNALAIARTWRTRVHPAFAISRAAKFDAKHTLDQYAILARYPGAKRLRNASPAKWIKHVATQLKARRYYRRVTRQAKRDWHRLLEYNHHDCVALRHVFRRAMFELDTWREYERTNYCVHDAPGRPICFRVGGTSARLDALLARNGAVRWAFLTAWNPASRPLGEQENRVRQDALLERLTREGFRCLPAEGRGADPAWPPEESVLALDIPRGVATRIARDFGQLAIVVGHRGRPARLVACAP